MVPRPEGDQLRLLSHEASSKIPIIGNDYQYLSTVGALILVRQVLVGVLHRWEVDSGEILYVANFVVSLLAVAIVIVSALRFLLFFTRLRHRLWSQSILLGCYWAVVFLASVGDSESLEAPLTPTLLILSFFTLRLPSSQMEGILRTILRVLIGGGILVDLAFLFVSGIPAGSAFGGIGVFPWRVSGLFSHPNALALAVSAGILLEIRRTRFQSIWLNRWLLAAYTLTLLGTQSAGSISGLLIVFLAMLLAVHRGKEEKGSALRWLGAGGVIAGAAGIVLAMFSAGRFDGWDKFTSGRVNLWAEAARGYNSIFQWPYGSLSSWSNEIQLAFPGVYSAGHSHNDLVHAYLTAGPIGLIFLSVFFVSVVRRLLETNLSAPTGLLAIFLISQSLVECVFLPRADWAVIAVYLVATHGDGGGVSENRELGNH